MPSDLHIHTTFSDGRKTPEEILEEARAAGLNFIAITDHDTLDGIRQLYEKGLYPSRYLHIIPGVEFSCEVEEHDVHILGYNLDIYDQELADKVTEISESRWTRFSQIVEKLRELGYEITEADVLKIAGSSSSIGRAHVARTLVKNGSIGSVREAFDKLLDHGQPGYVPHYRIEPEEAVALIRGAGGIPVLAHPKLVKDDSIVGRMLELDFGGLEVFYPKHDAEDVLRYKTMSESRGLLCTGGSDYHAAPQREPSRLGEFTIDDAFAEPFFRQPEAFE